MLNRVWRLARNGLAAALAVGVAGWALERSRFGASDEDALRRMEAELRQRLASSAETLGAMSARVGAEREAIRMAPRDPAAVRRLFDAVEAVIPAEESGRTGLTVYARDGSPLAWAGRASDLPRDRLDGPQALFVAPGALGPRLVRVEPVVSADRTAPGRPATIVVERLLGSPQGTRVVTDAVIVSTAIAPASLRAHFGDAASRPPYTFLIPSPGGGVLVDAEVAPADLARAHAQWRNGTWAAVWIIVAATLLLCAGPLLDQRQRMRDRTGFSIVTSTIVLTLLAARLVLRFGMAAIVDRQMAVSPVDLLLNAMLVTALTWLALDILERWRVGRPRPRLLTLAPSSLLMLGLAFAAAGAVDSWILVAYERFLERFVSGTTLDLLHFSLHPISATRLAIACGLVLLHASVIWTAAAVLRVPNVVRRTPRRSRVAAVALAGWLVGIAAGLAALRASNLSVPLGPLVVALGVAGGCAAAIGQLRGRARRASQTARLTAVFLALLVPALAMYPSLLAFATAAKERLVETEIGPQVVRQREELKERLYATLEQIDTLSSLPDLVAAAPPATSPTTDRAFLVWSKTDLAIHRLTSAVELYNASGTLISRFALNLPEYATASHQAATCEWDLFDEVSPFGSSERHVLHASRGICDSRGPVGSIVVRVMLDYETLPFNSSQSPYLESIRAGRQTPAEGAPGRDVEFVVYGWSRAPIYASGTSVWPLPDPLFQRMVDSREPFWTTLPRNDKRFRVYFQNDRGGIYALGYPEITLFGHLVNLAELLFLAAVLYVALMGGATIFNAVTSRKPASGRALLREVRSSFYRKLFLYFVAAAVVPVVILAVATRTYFATQLRAGLEEAAVKTVTVAQRLVEDYATLQQRSGALTAIDDQIMVLVGRAIGQDVNLFDRARLQATSERDLFESGLLTTRTPGDVYRTIALDRLPAFVGEEQVGELPYRLAAAPVRAGSREGIVTVPVALRPEETERQIDELDRRVLFASVLFSLVGAALGYWMAERIADPVNRLSRATRRIARGNLDARVAATSSDELRRLVEDFNRMADDLKRQRADLERTQRLEAWADMARQVAHDIKNPLTPIQLSAEHARRVNIDRGRPLSPVLDECVSAILTQVTLLRQISAEFSSFASQPTPRPEPTRLADAIEEVVAPYRLGLAGRIAIETRLPRDLPMVTIDRTLFSRALTNIVENALHAMPGKGKLIVDSHQSTVEGRPSVVIEITDTGVGMDQEAAARIFEPYFSTKATGTGLGLTIAKRNIELNGGTIAVTSQRGAGTTVTIKLPVEGDPVT